MERLIGIIGVFFILGLVYAISPSKEKINWRSVSLAFASQFVLSFLLLRTPLWKVVEVCSNGVSKILGFANEGINFVFGGLVPQGGFVFFINSLLPIVFLSSLIGLLFHFGILQKFVKVVGLTIAKFFKVNPLVAVNSIGNCFLGQSESLFLSRNYLHKASDNTIMATLVGGMTSISAGVIGLYAGYGASISYILISIPLTVLSALALLQIYSPTEYEDVDNLEISNEGVGENFIETMSNYGSNGFKSVVGIAVALMVFLSLVALVNGVLGAICPAFTLEKILGVIFYPFALIMGVPMAEVSEVAGILATKLVTNEAVAFGLPAFALLSAKTKAMVTIALCGFAGFGSIGILIGGYSAIAPNKVPTVAKLGVKALGIATLTNILSGAVIGLFI